jgi:hypothetical protein
MRLLERNPRLTGTMMGLAVLALVGARAQAQDLEITSTEPGSIVLYPKIISDGTRDSIISLTNTSNNVVYAHCVYTNGIGECSASPDPANQTYYCNTFEDCQDVTAPDGSPVDSAGACNLLWQAIDFDVTLTAQQPTFWRVSTGRVQDPNLQFGVDCAQSGNSQICPGFFIGDSIAGSNVPGQSAFRGEMRCFQVDMDGDLLPANSLKGEAFIESLAGDPAGNGRISGYNSINVEGAGLSTAAPDAALLDGVEYARCPNAVGLDYLNPATEDPATGADVDVELTFIPCTANQNNQTGFSVQLFTFDEFETRQSQGIPAVCWANIDAGNVNLTANGASTTFLRSEAQRTTSGNCQGGDPTGLGCFADSDCGGEGICNNGSCQGGDSTGRVCTSANQCSVGGVSGTCVTPGSSFLALVETIYSGNGDGGSDADVGYELVPGTSVDTMAFIGNFPDVNP